MTSLHRASSESNVQPREKQTDRHIYGERRGETRRTLDSGFRSCSDSEYPGLVTSKLRLRRKTSGSSLVMRRCLSDDTSNGQDEVFLEGDADVFFPASLVYDVESTRDLFRFDTMSLPAKDLTHRSNRRPLCSSLHCHCSACCACISESNTSRDARRSLNLTINQHDSVCDNDHQQPSLSVTLPPPTQSVLHAPHSPAAMITAWGHYNQRNDLHYKYARSDYSSDSDDEFMFHRGKSKPKVSRVPELNILSPSPSPRSGGRLFATDPPRSPRPTSPQLQFIQDVDRSISPTYPAHHPTFCEAKSNAKSFLSHSIMKQESRVCDTSQTSQTSQAVSASALKPSSFKDSCQEFTSWFGALSDEHRNMTLRHLLPLCNLPQMHLLSVLLQDRLHSGCPQNCQDILSWIPGHLATKVFSYLDPVSLCRASQVCQVWSSIASNPSLWQHFCCLPKWRLSKPSEHKQIVRHMSPDGCIQWQKVFAERFRLRKNWLTGRCSVRTFEGHTQGISCVQFDETRIVSGSSDKTIKVWNIRTNAPWSVQTLVGHSGTVRCLHLEGSKLVSGSTDRTIKVWDLSTQDSWSSIACKVTMVGHTDTVRCLQVDDGKVISGSYDKTLKIWDMRTGDCKNTLRGHMAAVLCVYFSDTKIVSGSCDKTIKVWNYEHCLMTLDGHRDAVTCLQFDSTRIVSGSLDCTLKFWDIHSGRCVNTIDWRDSEGHTGVVRCLQADSWRLVSAADDKTLKVWNLETGERLVTLQNHTDGVTCMQFNDFVIVSGSYDKTVKLWDFSCC